MTVEFDRRVIKNVGITVKLDNCSVGELVSNAGFCEGCSSTTYNFVLSANVCQTCPENGNCESRVITPNDGYWQKTPCSDHLHRCLPTSACESKGRSGKLNAKVEDVSNCDFGEEWIEDYTRAQCSEVSCILDSSMFQSSDCSFQKGHEGPLCGSCEEDFGSGLSSKCKECRKGFFNAAYILVSSIILLVITGITIHGTVSALRKDTAPTHDESAPSSSAEAIESPRLGTQVGVE